LALRAAAMRAAPPAAPSDVDEAIALAQA